MEKFTNIKALRHNDKIEVALKGQMPFIDKRKKIDFVQKFPKRVNVPKVLKRAIGR